MKARPAIDERSRARVRAWGADPGIVQLALVDQEIVPGVAEIQAWVDGIDDDGVHTVRTGALFPAAADRFAAAGFAVVDTLVLLRIDLTRVAPVPSPARDDGEEEEEEEEDGRGDDVAVTAPLRRHHHPAAAAIDRDAFGPPWGNDVEDLEEIRSATPRHHATGRFLRTGRLRRDLVAFAITGAAGGNGYLQRLAVAPRHQQGGHGRALTTEALAWMRRRRLHAGLVNTATANHAALALYTSLGFRPMSERLVVMQRPIGAP